MGRAAVVDRPEAVVARPAGDDAGRRRPAPARGDGRRGARRDRRPGGLLDLRGDLAARSRVEGIKSADIGQVLRLTRELGPLRPWAVPLLRREVEQGRGDAGARSSAAAWRCSPDDPGQVDDLLGRMLAEDPVTALVIREALWPRPRRRHAPALGGREGRPAPRRRIACGRRWRWPSTTRPDGRVPGPTARTGGRSPGPIADELVTMLDANPAAYSRPCSRRSRPIRGVLVPELKGPFLRRGDPPAPDGDEPPDRPGARRSRCPGGDRPRGRRPPVPQDLPRSSSGTGCAWCPGCGDAAARPTGPGRRTTRPPPGDRRHRAAPARRGRRRLGDLPGRARSPPRGPSSSTTRTATACRSGR